MREVKGAGLRGRNFGAIQNLFRGLGFGVYGFRGLRLGDVVA